MNDEELIEQAEGSEQVAEKPERPTGCYEHDSGTWIHKPGHPGCPSFLRGKLPNRRRMIP